jgi:hypothetical protein
MANKKDRAGYWIKQLEKASKEEQKWRKKAQKVIDRYRDERDELEVHARFNILWANTETLRPALISDTPRPEVRRRYQNPNDVARVAAKITERALEFTLDNQDFTSFGKDVVNDYLLTGRGVSKVRYVPTFEKKKKRVPLKMVEDGSEMKFMRDGQAVDEFDVDAEGAFVTDQVDELVFEEVQFERVPWKWFRMDPADCWKNVRWVAFGAPMDKDQLIDEFGTKGSRVQVTDKSGKSEAMKDKVIVWEIWDKRTRKQIFIAEDHDELLEENEDPLSLEGFFPMPRPIYAVEDNDTMVPTPEFCLYQDQADELDELTARIFRITKAIKARGAYAGEEHNLLKNILDADDNELVAVEDWIAFADKGGLDGVISWVPVDTFAKVLQILEAERAAKIQQIFELTGVSDIQRGVTDPRETAGAQSLKANFGNRRLLTKQQSVQNHFRDLLRISAELIGEQFDPNTLKLMVGLQSENELFDEALQLIKSDALRLFNIDVETDSTIAMDVERERQGMSQALEAIGAYAGQIFPLVQSGAIPLPAAMEILRKTLRVYRLGRDLDEVLDEAARQAQQQGPEQQQQQAEQQRQQQEMQMKQQEFEMKMKEMQAKLQALVQQSQVKLKADAQKADQDLVQDEEKHEQDLRQDQEKHEVKVQNEREMGEVKADVQRRQAQVNQPKVQE